MRSMCGVQYGNESWRLKECDVAMLRRTESHGEIDVMKYSMEVNHGD